MSENPYKSPRESLDLALRRDVHRPRRGQDAVHVVVIHGVGGRSFAAGADISEFEQQRANAEQKQRYGEVAARGQNGLAQLSKPLIAMITPIACSCMQRQERAQAEA